MKIQKIKTAIVVTIDGQDYLRVDEDQWYQSVANEYIPAHAAGLRLLEETYDKQALKLLLKDLDV